MWTRSLFSTILFFSSPLVARHVLSTGLGFFSFRRSGTLLILLYVTRYPPHWFFNSVAGMSLSRQSSLRQRSHFLSYFFGFTVVSPALPSLSASWMLVPPTSTGGTEPIRRPDLFPRSPYRAVPFLTYPQTLQESIHTSSYSSAFLH